MQHKYVTVFLVYHMVIAILIIGMYSISYALEVVGAVQLIYIILLLIVRPYYLKSQNILLIISQIIGFSFTALLIINQYITISDKYMSYIIVGYEILLIVVGVLAIVRIYLHSSSNERAFKLLREE